MRSQDNLIIKLDSVTLTAKFVENDFNCRFLICDACMVRSK